jgi:hypothetical protein
MYAEYADYLYSKFSSRLSSLRNTIRAYNDQATEDDQHFRAHVKKNPASSFSHKGYAEWAASDVRDFLQEDLKQNLHTSQ